MLIVLSPAKSLDYETRVATKVFTQPEMLESSQQLIEVMRTKQPAEVAALMSISEPLAELNVERYHDWELPFTPRNSRQAILAFNGDVYDGMAAPRTFSARDFTHAQKTLRILSGLYGLLRPLDLMMPYRLEMGTKIKTSAGSNLYDFWGDRLTLALNDAIDESPGPKALINLASQEYFGAVRPKKLSAPIISPAFYDRAKSGDLKIVSFFAKRARGEMAGWIIRERIKSVAALKQFTGSGYAFDPVNSTATQPIFVRDPVGQ